MKKCPNCNKEYSDEIFYCPRCNYRLKRIEGSKTIYREEYNQQHVEREDDRKKYENEIIVECPYCHSTNIKKITITKRAVKTALFGFLGAMDDAGKTWQCENCDSKF